MFNTCLCCGEYRADKAIDPDGPYAVCPFCGYKYPFLQLPLLIVTGASRAGKSRVCLELASSMKEVVLLDSDILWREEFNRPDTHYRDYFEVWLRVCKNISQSVRPVVLFGAGVGVPENMEPCVERRYFSALHYLALTCADEVLADRLRKHPKWRLSADKAYIDQHISFNRWFKDNAHKTDPTITLLDTTKLSVRETVAQVAAWICEKAGMPHSLK